MTVRIRTSAMLAAFVASAAVLSAQSAGNPVYLTPPRAIVDILDAAPLPNVVVSPAGDTLALLTRRSMPSIAELSEPMLRLAGMRINPQTDGPQRAPSGTGITLRSISGVGARNDVSARSDVGGGAGNERRIALPANPRIGGFSFSPDGSRFTFTNTRENRIDLYVGTVATGQTRQVDAALNGIGPGCEWLNDSSALLCGFVPAKRAAMPPAPKAPTGPNIQEHFGPTGPVRTFEDLLTSAYDEQLFEYFFTSELGFVRASDAARTPAGKAGMIADASSSPDGKYILVQRIKRPFSRLLPWSQFPRDVELWSRAGETMRAIADVPMGDVVPMLGVMKGPRGYRWQPLEPAALLWVEALDGGDIKNTVPHRDRIFSLAAPFTGQPQEVGKTEFRFGGASWTEQGTILLTENDRATRTTRTWLLDRSWRSPRKLWDRKQQDAYSAPGSPMFRPGRGVIRQSGDFIYLNGTGPSPEGDRPFLDRLNLATLATERLFRSDSTSYESIVSLLDDSATRVLTRFETRTQPPNYRIRDLKGATQQALTDFKDPHPQITAAERSFVTYKRKDGVQLSGRLYLPTTYQKGTRVPLFIWAYPEEFADPAFASQVVGSPNRFSFVTGASHLLLLTQGYAVFDGPTMPIVGAGETSNDTYVDQLVASAEAAIDKAVEMGVADRQRVGVGGHSYGAFMTANLLAHSDLFAAGIARSGAYNRSLTPFGFQNETRTFWEVPQVYEQMSPFWFANKIKEPILLTHGEMDDNPGTFPIQSERFYMALKGHGATVRYVTLPHEAHGYAARESNFHTIAEMLDWLNKHVKNAPVGKPAGTTGN